MNQEFIIYVFVLALFEFYESSWQRGQTLKEVIENIYRRFQKGIFYFLFSHPSFYYVLYIGIKYDLTNFWFLSILFFKFLDISYKLVIVQKIRERKLQEVLPLPLEIEIQRWMSYLNVLIYPLLLTFSFIHSLD